MLQPAPLLEVVERGSPRQLPDMLARMPDADGSRADVAAVRSLVEPYRGALGGPLAALRRIQAKRGWIDAEAMDVVADAFNLSRAEVRGLVEFYADFHSDPPADHVVKVCQAESCQAAGGRELTRSAERRLGVALGQTAVDRSVRLEAVYCLGLCAVSPAAMVDGRMVVGAEATERALDKLFS